MQAELISVELMKVLINSYLFQSLFFSRRRAAVELSPAFQGRVDKRLLSRHVVTPEPIQPSLCDEELLLLLTRL